MTTSCWLKPLPGLKRRARPPKTNRWQALHNQAIKSRRTVIPSRTQVLHKLAPAHSRATGPGLAGSRVQRRGCSWIKERQAKEDHDRKHQKILQNHQEQILQQNHLGMLRQEEMRQKQIQKDQQQHQHLIEMAKLAGLADQGLLDWKGEPLTFAGRQEMIAEGKSSVKQHFASKESILDQFCKGGGSRQLPFEAKGLNNSTKDRATTGTSAVSSERLEDQADVQRRILKQYEGYLKGSTDYKPRLLRLLLETARGLNMDLPWGFLESMAHGIEPRFMSESQHLQILKQLSTPPNQVAALQSMGQFTQQAGKRSSAGQNSSDRLLRFSIRGSGSVSDQSPSDPLDPDLSDPLAGANLHREMGRFDQDLLLQPLLNGKQQPHDAAPPSLDFPWHGAWAQNERSVKKQPAASQRAGRGGLPPDVSEELFGPLSSLGPILGNLDHPSAAEPASSSLHEKLGESPMVRSHVSRLLPARG